jgi:hypothetical protein
MSIQPGHRVYYLDRYYQTVFGRIESVKGDDATVKDEVGHRLSIKLSWLNEFNRVCPPPRSDKPAYKTCFCGSIRFQPLGDNYTCIDCGSVWDREELFSLSESEYSPAEDTKNCMVQ